MESKPLLTFEDLAVKLAPKGLGDFRMVRHREPGLDLADIYFAQREALEVYQSLQGQRRFECERIFSFLGVGGGRALFLGGYDVVTKAVRVDLPSVESVPSAAQDWLRRWHAGAPPDAQCWKYELRHDSTFAQMEMRVEIEWSVRSMTLKSASRPVSGLRATGAVEPCPEYGEIEVSLAKLSHILRHPGSNPSWVEKLSAVGGIYLLSDHGTNRLYVGKTDARRGFWSRWSAYANLRSGNVLVDAAMDSGELDPVKTYLSVLDVVPRGSASEAAIEEMESRWKRKLLTRQSGYNAN